MRFLNQLLFRTSTPQKSQLRSSSVARLIAKNISTFKSEAVLANPSLNRTICGTPALGFISFSPNTGVPQNAD